MKNISLKIIKSLNKDAERFIEDTSIKKLINKAIKLGNGQTKLHNFTDYAKFGDNQLHFTTKIDYTTYYLILSTLSADEMLKSDGKKYVGEFSTVVEDKLTTYNYNLIVNNGAVDIIIDKTVKSIENTKLNYEPKQTTIITLTEQEVNSIFDRMLTV